VEKQDRSQKARNTERNPDRYAKRNQSSADGWLFENNSENKREPATVNNGDGGFAIEGQFEYMIREVGAGFYGIEDGMMGI
jgi:hypothetical protein